MSQDADHDASQPGDDGGYVSSSLEESSQDSPSPRPDEAPADVQLRKVSVKRSPSTGHVPSFAPPPVPAADDDEGPAHEGETQELADDEERRERAATLIQAWGRRLIARQRFSLQAKRSRVAHELLETEITYVAGLELMIRLYMKPLLASARSTDPIMPRTKVQTIFSVVEVMTNLNKVLLDDLKKRLDAWHVDQVLGDIFLTMGDYLKVATQYVNNYETAVKTISEELKTNDRFKLYYNEMRETPECRKNDLKAYLILPVQRIPRYEMLLRELIRKTPRDHADYQPLEAAYAKIQSISGLIDSRKDEDIKFREVVRLHALFDPRVPNLVAPTRRFISETPFAMAAPQAKGKPVSVVCFLFNDLLVIAERIVEPPAKSKTLRGKPEVSSPPPSAVRYKPRHVHPLAEIKCQLLKDSILIAGAVSGSPDESNKAAEVQLSVAEGDDPTVLVTFVKKYSKARLQLESSASSSGLSLRPSRSSEGEMLPLAARSPSDPSSRRDLGKNGPPTRSDPTARAGTRRASGSFGGHRSQNSVGGLSSILSSDTVLSSPEKAQGGSDSVDMAEMAERTRQDTLAALQEMRAEMDRKMNELKEKMNSADSDEDKQRYSQELQTMKLKAVSMERAIEGQGSMGVMEKANTIRQRSSSEVVRPQGRARSASGFGVHRSADAQATATAVSGDSTPTGSLSSSRKSLFTIRKKKRDSLDMKKLREGDGGGE